MKPFLCVFVFVAAREQLRRSRHSRTFLVESGTGELWSELQTGECVCVCVLDRFLMFEILMILTFNLSSLTIWGRHIYFKVGRNNKRRVLLLILNVFKIFNTFIFKCLILHFKVYFTFHFITGATL